MTKIAYEFALADMPNCSAPVGPVVVRLEGRVVGKIRPVGSGYQYVPKNQPVGGDVFPSFAACQASLEGEA